LFTKKDECEVNILIANDDGILAPGLQALTDVLKPLGRIVVVAPESERSGFSSALTLDRPLRAIQIASDKWSVNGTPADCVFLALNGLFDFEFDLVVSGINSGANLADDVLYSGTVGAAFEGRLLKQPALAISLAGDQVKSYIDKIHYQQAAQWVHDFIASGLPKIPFQHVLNINIPDVFNIKGVKVTHLGEKKLLKPVTACTDIRGRDVQWIGLSGEEVVSSQKGEISIESDLKAVSQGYVSITPIQMDRTNYAILETLSHQLRL